MFALLAVARTATRELLCGPRGLANRSGASSGSRPRQPRPGTLLAAVVAFAVSGCSIHPIPDDVPPRIPTEEIVKSARCEMRLGLFDQVKRLLKEEGFADFDVNT